MKRYFIFLCFLPLFLSSCGSLKTSKSLPQKLEKIILEKGVFIATEDLFPLPFEGVYLQHLTSSYQGKKQMLSVHLTLLPDSFKAIAFHDIAGQFYELNWREKALTFMPSSFMPKYFDPHYILADFLVSHLPLEILQKHLRGATVFENNRTRLLQKGNKVLREITYENIVQNALQNAHLKNPRHHYELDIKTAVLP